MTLESVQKLSKTQDPLIHHPIVQVISPLSKFYHCLDVQKFCRPMEYDTQCQLFPQNGILKPFPTKNSSNISMEIFG